MFAHRTERAQHAENTYRGGWHEACSCGRHERNHPARPRPPRLRSQHVALQRDAPPEPARRCSSRPPVAGRALGVARLPAAARACASMGAPPGRGAACGRGHTPGERAATDRAGGLIHESQARPAGLGRVLSPPQTANGPQLLAERTREAALQLGGSTRWRINCNATGSPSSPFSPSPLRRFSWQPSRRRCSRSRGRHL